MKFLRWLGCMIYGHRIVTTCIWHTEPHKSDTEGRSWDGAYHAFCTRCRRFEAEWRHGPNDPCGEPYIDERRDLIRISDNIVDYRPDVVNDPRVWVQAGTFRAQQS